MRSAFILLLTLALPALSAQAADSCAPAPPIQLLAALPPPPAADSPVANEELKVVLAAQASRTAASSADALADAKNSVFRFADAIGPSFTAAALPKVEAYFACVAAVDKADAGQIKRYWHRPRPPVVSAQVHPLKPDKPDDWGYPSGHATQGYTSAILLAAMLPEKRTAIFARADGYAHNRIVVGVHFPSDVEAGRLAGTLIGASLLDDPAWQASFIAARNELRQALGLPAQPPAMTDGAVATQP
jgi:acid phosphatase (class A)